MLPEFVDAGAFPAAAGLGVSRRRPGEVGKMSADKGGDGLAVAFETKADIQFIGDELEVGRSLEGDELIEEAGNRLWPHRTMITAGRLGVELGAFAQPPGAETVEVGATYTQLLRGIRGIDASVVKLLEDALHEGTGEAFGQLLFFTKDQ